MKWANTGEDNSPYEWNDVQLGKVQPNPADPNAHFNSITSAKNGCASAECAAGIGNFSQNPIEREDVANAAALVGRGAGIVGNTATAASVVPGPHQPLAGTAAVAATGVGFGTAVVENIARPNPGQVLIEGTADILAKVIFEKFPLLSPVLNEVLTALKNTEVFKNAQKEVNGDLGK